MTLSAIGEMCGTDKGTVHSYLDLYDVLIPKDKPISILEIGIGASIKMWLEAYPLAQVRAIDSNKFAVRLTENEVGRPMKDDVCRFIGFVADATDAFQLDALFSDSRFDIIIDDASHKPEDQIMTFHYLFRYLKPGGIYFVEDVINDAVAEYWRIPGSTIYPIHKNRREDDILIQIRKE